MERDESINHIRECCKKIAIELMRIHPAVPGLADKSAQDEMYETLFRLTKDVEVIKKRLGKLEKKDTPEL